MSRRSASSSATAVLPEAVGPKTAITSGSDHPRRAVSERVHVGLARAARACVVPHRAVASLELGQDAHHRFCRSTGEPPSTQPFVLVPRGVDPWLPRGAKVLLGEGIVGAHVLAGDACEPEQQRAHQSRPVLAGLAVDDDSPLARVRHGCERCGDLGPKPLQTLEVDQSLLGDVVRSVTRNGCDLVPVRGAGLGEERNVNEHDGKFDGRVGGELAVLAQIDDPSDPVVDQCAPASRRERAHAVCADHGAVARLAAVLGRVPAQVADVQASVPGQGPAAEGH